MGTKKPGRKRTKPVIDDGFAKRLEQLVIDRFANNMSEFSRACGIKRGTNVHHWLGGRQRPGYVWLIRMAQIGINIHWLLTGENPTPVSAGSSQKVSVVELISRLRTDLTRLEAELAPEDSE